MKIYNSEFYLKRQNLFIIFIIISCFIVLDLKIIHAYLSSSLINVNFMTWIMNKFLNADLYYKLGYILIASIQSYYFYMLVENIKNDKQNDDTIQYLEFLDKRLNLVYKNSLLNKNLQYTDVDKLKLIFKTGKAYAGKGVTTNYIYGYTLKLVSNNMEYQMYTTPCNLNILYKLIYFTQFIKKFEYKFEGNGYKAKEKIVKNINKIINNDYHATMSMIFFQNIVNVIWLFLLTIMFILIIIGIVLII